MRDDIPEVANDDIESRDREQDGSIIQVYHYHNDQLGTPNELTNDKGKVVWLADYEAWGNTAKTIWREQVIDQIQVSQNELQPIRFQGQHYDIETGLHYNRFRYYDPDMGMFTTRDPIGLMGGDNVFQYAPNPVNWVDPLGLRGGLSRGSISKAEGMNQARVMNGDGPLCNILGIGCNDDHFKCTSATYPKKDGTKATVDYESGKPVAIPTGVLWPPTPSYVEAQGGKCEEVMGRSGREYTIK